MQIIYDNAAKQLSESTTVANLLDMSLKDFESAIKSIRKEYKNRHNIGRGNEEEKHIDGQRAFYLVLKTAKAIQSKQKEILGIEISPEQAVKSAIKKLSAKTDKRAAKLVDYNWFNWLQHFADRIATVLQSSRFEAECKEAKEMGQLKKGMLLVAQNAVWKGYKDGDSTTAYADHIIRNGIYGEEWGKLQKDLFDDKLILDCLQESKRYTHLKFERTKYETKKDDGNANAPKNNGNAENPKNEANAEAVKPEEGDQLPERA